MAVFETLTRLGTRTRGSVVLLAERERRFAVSDGADTGRVLAPERDREVAVLGRTFATKKSGKHTKHA